MSGYTVNTRQERDVVVINEQRYLVLGMNRRIQRDVFHMLRDVRAIDAQVKEITKDGAELNGEMPELADKVARLLISAASLRLQPETDGGLGAEAFLTGLWDSDELERDTHLEPLIAYLYPQAGEENPPA